MILFIYADLPNADTSNGISDCLLGLDTYITHKSNVLIF